MSGPVTRKIELAHQLEEARETAKEPAVAARSSLQGERMRRRAAIVVTLEWMLQHETTIREWAKQRGEQV